MTSVCNKKVISYNLKMPRIMKRAPKRSNGHRKTYIPQELRLQRVSRPYASKYGDECFIKVQKVVELQTQNLAGDVYAVMRQDIAASDATNFVPFD